MKKIFGLVSLIFTSLQSSLFAAYPFPLVPEIAPASENWIFSPFSISSCLSMVAEGAREETLEEMSRSLNLPSDFSHKFADLQQALVHNPSFERDFQLHLAQGVWVKEGFSLNADYQTALQQSYKAAIESKAFTPETCQEINRWIASQTGEKIQDLLSAQDINNATRLVLANALYFQGNWKYPFVESTTKELPFYVTDREVKQVAQMHQVQKLGYFENEAWQAVALPFVQEENNASHPLCLLFLPKTEPQQSLDEETVRTTLHSLSIQKVDLQVPRFTLEQKIDLKPYLHQMGIRSLFSKEANLSGISLDGPLYVDAVFHKSFFSFNEAGVEAAAATAAVINLTTSFTPPEQVAFFHADRPFFFALVDQTTETLLFVGHVQTP